MPFTQPECQPLTAPVPNGTAVVSSMREVHTLHGERLFTNFRPAYGYMYLAYLGFLLLDPLLDGGGMHAWLKTFAVIAVFFVIFRAYVNTSSERTRRIATLLIFVLGLLTLPWNTGGSTFFVYAAGFIPFSFAAIPVVLALFGLELGSLLAEHYVLHVHWFACGLSAFLLLIVGCSNIFFAEQKRANAALRLKQEDNEALAAVAERERIARDLHDVLGHTLSVIVLKSELAARLLAQPDDGAHSQQEREAQRARAASEIADVERTARTALSEVREAIGGYRARGFLAEIETARRTLDAAGVRLRADAPAPAAGTLTAAQETVLSLTLREAVTNIVRHARATTCTLHFDTRLSANGGTHSLRIEDDGLSNAPTVEGNGLRGMRERVESLGGQLRMTRNGGMQLAIDLPAAR